MAWRENTIYGMNSKKKVPFWRFMHALLVILKFTPTPP